METNEATPHGWASDFEVFRGALPATIRASLAAFVRDASLEQINAWDESIPPFQSAVGEAIDRDPGAADFTTIWEYELPLEYRRSDVILLIGGAIAVLELKGKSAAAQADIDQVAAYARDLRAYHVECETRPVLPILVLMRARGDLGERAGVRIVGPDLVDALVATGGDIATEGAVGIDRFLAIDAYRPLPSLVEAARELLEHGDIRRIRRANSATEPTVEALADIAKEAARTGSRHLVLVTGLPGSGKTLVGLQLAHARFLDDLAVPRVGGKPTAPAVFLSGNGPLVQVLQYELKGAGGSGKAFVRDVKAYVERYSRHPELVPPEHVLIFDEAQRAFDADQVATTHEGRGDGKSEPEHFVEFAERVPEWCVIVGLIGTGQEIHVGEEGGIGQWLTAVEGASQDWTIHVPPSLADVFGSHAGAIPDARLELSTELRFHLTTNVHRFVAGLLDEDPTVDLPSVAAELERSGYHLRIARDLDRAKEYLRSRYAEDPTARFGMIASARDSMLSRYSVPNDFNSTKRVNYGPWFAEGEDDPRARSCRQLRECVTEFGCQGLELDATLLCWGNDLVRKGGDWSNEHARRYQRPSAIKDAMRLRRNAYRVLLTRGRDATVVYVPDANVMDETFDFLLGAGFVELHA